MKQNKLWRTFLAVSISALAFPALVQSQATTGGSSTGGAGSPPSATGSMGAGETSGTTGSSRMGESSRSPSDSGMSATGQSTSAMSDQATTEADRTLNQNIRQQLMSDSSLGSSAGNIHFKTDNGKVTLQGTVATEKEKQEIESKVENMSGVKDVDNQLQIGSTSSSAPGGLGSSSSTRSGASDPASH